MEINLIINDGNYVGGPGISEAKEEKDIRILNVEVERLAVIFSGQDCVMSVPKKEAKQKEETEIPTKLF